MPSAAFEWGPISTRQAKALTWWRPGSGFEDYNGLICDGAIRSGKTVCMAFSFVTWATSTFNGHNFAICGKTIESCRRNVITTLKRQLEARGYEIRDRRSENLLIISSGGRTNSFYIFGGKDERSQDLIQGITLAGVFMDEVALMPESFVNQATARCSVAGSTFWFNCNPAGPFHWFRQNWILNAKRRRICYLHFTMDDNLTLTPEIKERYRAQWSGVFYKRFILGEWAAADGIIYDMFDRDRHVVQTLPALEGEIYVSGDFGTQNPTAFLFWQKVAGRDAWAITREYYYNGRESQRQKTVAEYVDDLEEILGDVKPRRVIVDPSATPLIAELKKRRFSVMPAENDVLDGIADVASMFRDDRIIISASCKNTISELGVYQWDPKAADRGEDRPVKTNDHAMDALRYFVRTKRLAKKREKYVSPFH